MYGRYTHLPTWSQIVELYRLTLLDGPNVDAKTKRPHHFQPVAKPFAFAGGWDVWQGDGKEPITSFSIVTTSPAPSTARYHGSEPVRGLDAWVAPMWLPR